MQSGIVPYGSEWNTCFVHKYIVLCMGGCEANNKQWKDCCECVLGPQPCHQRARRAMPCLLAYLAELGFRHAGKLWNILQ